MPYNFDPTDYPRHRLPDPDLECEVEDCCDLAIYGEPVCAKHMIEDIWATMKRIGGHEGMWSQINAIKREHHIC